MELRKIRVEEFDKLKELFPGNGDMWLKYRKIKEKQLKNEEIDIFIIKNDIGIIGEITVNYKSNELEIETIPNKRVYLETFRIKKEYQGQGLGQKLINYCIYCLKNEGYTEFTIGVEENNEVAKNIYSKLGFSKAIGRGKGNEFDSCEYTLYLKDN